MRNKPSKNNLLAAVFDFYDHIQSDLLCVLNLDFTVAYVNHSFVQLIGGHKEDFVGKHLSEIIAPTLIAEMEQHIKNAPDKEAAAPFETQIIHKNRTGTPISWTIKFDKTNALYLLSGKELENPFQNNNAVSDNPFQTILNLSSDGFFILNKKWEIVYANQTSINSVKHLNLPQNKTFIFWDIFPKAKESKIYTQLHWAFEEQVPVSFEEYSPTLNKWFKIDAVPYGDKLNVISKDLSAQVIAKKLNELDTKVFEMNIKGKHSAEELMLFILETLEAIHPEMHSSILKVENDRLYPFASPKLPAEYTNQINGLLIGPFAGSCGTAAYLKKSIVVEDIATNPRWKDYKNLILIHGYKSCWSYPIFNINGQKVIATFAIYYQEKRKPNDIQLKTIERIANTIKIILEDIKNNEVLRISNNRYAMATMATNDAIYEWDKSKNTTYWNDNVFQLFGFPIPTINESSTWWEDHIHPDDRERITNSLEAAFADKKIAWYGEYRFMCQNGSSKYVNDSAFIIYDKEADNAINMIGAIQDINELKEKELSVTRQNTQLKKIAQISSHELRGPVSSILGLTSLFDKVNTSNLDNKQIINYLELAAKELDQVVHSIVAKTLEDEELPKFFKN